MIQFFMPAQLAPSPALIARLLDVIENDITPITRKGVARGAKIFGAAILRKSDLSLVLAETNNEMENPLWHGEVHAIKRFHELPPAMRPAPRDCVFIATHEPCSLCLSAITWAGFDNFYFLFSHEDSRDAFNIPHDLKILKEVFRLDPGGYNLDNAYWSGHPIKKLASALDADARAEAVARIAQIAAIYDALSAEYQRSKTANTIPLN
jgi:tRNA(Arg) A34 adenosine deaminase TadA